MSLGTVGAALGQVYDVMAVGVAKQKYDMHKMSMKDRTATEPEEVKLADRAQMNQVRIRQSAVAEKYHCPGKQLRVRSKQRPQVEQVTPFFTGALMFGFLVTRYLQWHLLLLFFFVGFLGISKQSEKGSLLCRGCWGAKVNGKVGGILSLIYFTLRRLYCSTYRASVGKSLEGAGLFKYTVPCYFILNGVRPSPSK